MKWLLIAGVAVAAGIGLNRMAQALAPEQELPDEFEPVPRVPRITKTVVCGSVPIEVELSADPQAACEELYRAHRIQEERDLGYGWTL